MLICFAADKGERRRERERGREKASTINDEEIGGVRRNGGKKRGRRGVEKVLQSEESASGGVKRRAV